MTQTRPLTKNQIVTEILKCGKNPKYFINNFCRISHPLEGLIPFRTYTYQEQLLEDFNGHRFNVICKARQLGITTVTAGYIVWMMLFHKEKNVLVIATKFATAAGIVKKTKTILKALPEWIRIANITIDNRSSFELSNGSEIKASPTSVDAGRSEALSLLVIDEAAHVDNLEDIWTALYPTLSTGGRCIALSTPNGVSNWFHKTYTEAVEKDNEFKPTLLPWDVHPERDLNWFEKETKNMSKRQIAQELMCNFNSSGDTVIDSETINNLYQLTRDPIVRSGIDNNIWHWELPRDEFTYLIAADVARGDGEDSSAFHCFKLETMEAVSEYKGKATPDQFSQILYSHGKAHGNCMIVVENNTVGYMVIERLKELEYPNVYHSLKNTHEYVEQHVAEGINSAIGGFSTTVKTRPLLIAKFEEYVRNNIIRIYSERLISEMKTFVWHNGKPKAMKGYNDDLIMSCAIGCWVRDTVFEISQKNVEYTKSFINGMIVTNSSFDTTVPGMDGIYTSTPKNKAEHIYRNFGWLIKG